MRFSVLWDRIKKKFRWWQLVAALVFTAIAGAVLAILGRDKRSVFDLKEQMKKQVKKNETTVDAIDDYQRDRKQLRHRKKID